MPDPLARIDMIWILPVFEGGIEVGVDGKGVGRIWVGVFVGVGNGNGLTTKGKNMR